VWAHTFTPLYVWMAWCVDRFTHVSSASVWLRSRAGLDVFIMRGILAHAQNRSPVTQSVTGLFCLRRWLWVFSFPLLKLTVWTELNLAVFSLLHFVPCIWCTTCLSNASLFWIYNSAKLFMTLSKNPVQAVSLLSCIRDVSVSNLGRDTSILSGGGLCFSSVPPGKFRCWTSY
jgi:hypothetical protein